MAKPTSQAESKKAETAGVPAARGGSDPDARPGLNFMPDYVADEGGCTVDRVTPGGAAAKAGIVDGDLITALNGEEIEDFRAYMEVLGGLRVGQKVKVVLMRAGKEIEVDIVVGESYR